jgi:type IV fimbrial biogenesis protein FimT
MQTTKQRNLGLSLIEIMMTLAVLATLVAAAAPAFGKLMQSTAAQTSRSALTTALNTARIFAASKNVYVVVCPSADQQYCGRTTEWQHGWLIFIDADDDGARDAGEELLGVSQAQPDGVAILSTAGRTHIDYRPDGSATGSNVTFTVCDRRGADDATALVVNNAGRVRSGKPTEAAATACEQILDQPRA